MAARGRPKKSEKYSGQVVAAEDLIADKLPRLIDNLMELADGVTVRVEGEDGTTRVYTKAPDYRANTYLIDRVMGKPTERHEADVTSNGETVQTVFYLPENGRDRAPDPGDPPPAGAAGSLPGDLG